MYYTGSTTKSFTAAAILKLIEDTADSENPVKLDSPISDFVDFVVPDDYASRHATLEDLLCHRTGMPAHDLSYGGPNFTLSEMVRNLRQLPMTAELRQRWQYCNMMFCTLSHAIETITGSWLGDVFHDWFWKPLKMHRTFLSLEDARRAAQTDPKTVVARGYTWDNKTQQHYPEEYVTDEFVGGAGGIISSVMDYSLYLRALIYMDARILSGASYDELRTPRVLNGLPAGPGNPFVFSAYGLGWQFGYYRGHILYHHGGSVPGFASWMVYIPEKEIGLVMMGNTDESSALVELILATELLQRVFDVPADERIDVESEIDLQLRVREANLLGIVPPALPHHAGRPEAEGAA